jgi:hypothetical protein
MEGVNEKRKEVTGFRLRYSEMRSPKRCLLALIRRPMSTGAVSNYGKQQRHYKDKYNRLYALIGNLKGKTNLVLLNGKWHPDLRIVNSIQNT